METLKHSYKLKTGNLKIFCKLKYKVRICGKNRLGSCRFFLIHRRVDYVEKMISSEEREGESEETNFISFNYSLNVQYFPLHIKCSHETQYSLRSSDHLFAGNSREKMGNL